MHILFLLLVPRCPKRKGAAEPAPKVFHLPGSRPTRPAILLVDASQEPQERT
jgi:hypothetical protein